MAIYSKPEDEHYRGPCTYRLIVNEQNYCGKTFTFKDRMWGHKSKAKTWKERLARGEHVQDVHFCISDGWINVTIEIIARYPDKDKDNEEDKLFMCEREVEAIAHYDSFHNGLNMDEGGRVGVSKRMMGKQYGLGYHHTEATKQAISQRMMGKKIALGYRHTEETKANMSRQKMGNNFASYTHTPEQNQAKSLRMMGNNNNAKRRKLVTATKGNKTWSFESAKKAGQELSREFNTTFQYSSVKNAARGKNGKSNPHVYKGITFSYDP